MSFKGFFSGSATVPLRVPRNCVLFVSKGPLRVSCRVLSGGRFRGSYKLLLCLLGPLRTSLGASLNDLRGFHEGFFQCSGCM